MILLYTERPALLERERETHAWMKSHRPAEQLGLELVVENRPGGWPRYAATFADVWERCAREGTGFINVESDVVPTLEAFRSLLVCPEPACAVPYRARAWDPWPAWSSGPGPLPLGSDVREGTPWAGGTDLGFCRFSAEAVRTPLPPEARFDSQRGLLHVIVWHALGDRVHLHWPGLRTNHDEWDEGDDAHWPGEELGASPEKIQALLDRAKATGGSIHPISLDAGRLAHRARTKRRGPPLEEILAG